MNMFDVEISDTCNNPQKVVVQIEKCLRASLKSKSKKILLISDKEGEEERSRLRSELSSSLGHPFCWADPVDFGTPRLFINVKPTNWTGRDFDNFDIDVYNNIHIIRKSG